MNRFATAFSRLICCTVPSAQLNCRPPQIDWVTVYRIMVTPLFTMYVRYNTQGKAEHHHNQGVSDEIAVAIDSHAFDYRGLSMSGNLYEDENLIPTSKDIMTFLQCISCSHSDYKHVPVLPSFFSLSLSICLFPSSSIWALLFLIHSFISTFLLYRLR